MRVTLEVSVVLNVPGLPSSMPLDGHEPERQRARCANSCAPPETLRHLPRNPEPSMA
jgi:hypothetical protein